MTDDSIVDMGAAVRDLKAKQQKKFDEARTHFDDFIEKMAPLVGLKGRPLVDFGWADVVQRIARLRSFTERASHICEFLIEAKPDQLDHAQINNLLGVIVEDKRRLDDDFARQPNDHLEAAFNAAKDHGTPVD